jgi:iron(II)-dependent oxidoreductase
MPKERPAGANGETRVEVHLKKPFLGMRPGVYLTVLYALLALAVLFFLFFYKGLRDRGVYLRVISSPPGAAVSVDGQYAGSTPCEILVKKGTRRIVVSRPYFQAMTLEDDFSGPIFGTLFVRPRRRWDPKLQIADLQGLTSAALQDFAANPHIPEILEQTAAAALTAGSGEAQDHLSAFLDKAKFFVSSPLQYKYFQDAYSLLQPTTADLAADELTARIRDLASEGGRFDNVLFWLALVLPEEASRSLQASASYQDFARGYQEELRALVSRLRSQTAAGIGPALRIEGLAFRTVPAGTLLAGSLEETSAAYLPHPVPMTSFLASETEVPNRLYARFLAENPEWRKQNAAALAQQGRVDDAYLSNWTEQGLPAGEEELPVTNVSYFAAQAFCRWLSGRLPSSLAGYEARLPSEAEWEWAARGGLVGSPYPQGAKPLTEVFFEPGIAGPRPAGSSAPNGYGLRDTSGNVWEWCSDWFSPVAYLFSSRDAAGNSPERSSEIPFGAEKAVRGGSWANEKELVKLHSRASQPPSWCTPYLGFRVVLARARS